MDDLIRRFGDLVVDERIGGSEGSGDEANIDLDILVREFEGLNLRDQKIEKIVVRDSRIEVCGKDGKVFIINFVGCCVDHCRKYPHVVGRMGEAF